MFSLKRIFITIVALFLLLPAHSLAQTNAPQVYIALGDSIAAGQTPNREIDTGYTDLIAMRLQQQGQLAFYTKQLAFPGYTVDDVLKRVQSEEATPLLSKATLITISAGANDLLRIVQANMNAGTLTYSQLATDYALNNARKKMQLLLEELKTQAPLAKVYVVGYYFAYPYAHETQKQGTKSQLETLNTILKQEAERAGATYVSVFEDFGLEAKALVPNPFDVHPNMDGYRVIANAVLKSYYGTESYAISSAELPKPNPLSFEQLMQRQQQQSNSKEAKDNKVSVEGKKVQLQQYIFQYGYDRDLI